ncbi:glycerol-3-phosphate 1-O-acyltransferase PlsY [Tahibacter caeni]|uniref:glycerol-3-phosphate 1-O-acyltransferase PlsY n=1 Tax=Tahibacter caeni TaxID=1453545 RepID=UPI0021483CE5|nr:glycerol-3-phosphate 1-O-acyltransferase PlsY [Tahibacter caeni]
MFVLMTKAVFAYALGSVSGSLLLGRRQGFDIRRAGSGNAGGTNALRTRGWRFALGVVVIDIGKGALAVWLALLVPTTAASPGLHVEALACGFAAVLGHVFPVYYGFRGGKGAATVVGTLAVLQPLLLAPLLLVWLAILTTTGYVGLATVIAGLSLVPLTAWIAPHVHGLLAYASACAVLLTLTHAGNLLRLYRGTEHRFERARVLARLFAERR